MSPHFARLGTVCIYAEWGLEKHIPTSWRVQLVEEGRAIGHNYPNADAVTKCAMCFADPGSVREGHQESQTCPLSRIAFSSSLVCLFYPM